MKEKIISSEVSLLYVFRNKDTGEYINERGDLTTDIGEAIGFHTMDESIRYLEGELDEPDSWYIVTKITNITIIGTPIEVTTFI